MYVYVCTYRSRNNDVHENVNGLTLKNINTMLISINICKRNCQNKNE